MNAHLFEGFGSTLKEDDLAFLSSQKFFLVGRFPVLLIDWPVLPVGGNVLYQQADLAYPLFLCLDGGQEPVLFRHHFINLTL